MTFLIRRVHSRRAVLAASILLVLGTLGIGAQAPAAKPDEPGWKPLFDGKTLANWQTTKFSGDGGVTVENGQIILGTGRPLTGITWAGGDCRRPTTRSRSRRCESKDAISSPA